MAKRRKHISSVPWRSFMGDRMSPRTRKARLTPTEFQEQVKLVVWMTKSNIPHFAIPNGGARQSKAGFMLKMEGVKAGIPDLCIPVPTKTYHGLYIELKRQQGGRVSDAQAYWIAYFNSVGYHARIANGFDEAKIIITEYLRS
jgi:hypothetical protein